MDNAFVVGVPVGIVIGIIIMIASFMLMAYSRNKNRYDIPKYLPRDDERAWALVSACSRRIWSLRKCRHLYYDNWDLGILVVPTSITLEYDTSPTFGDVILAPKKWGGLHACVITKELGDNRFVTTYLGEFNGQARVIFDGRNRAGAKVIQ